jgi:cytochrome d ubiquinol oxidase subunit II
VRAFRSRALGAGIAAGALALGGLAVLAADADRLFDGLTEGAGLAAVAVSALAGTATLALIWAERFEPARYTAALAVAAIVAGWGIAQSPEILPGLTIEEAAAGRSVLIATLASIAAGLLILIPSLGLLFGLTLRGRFDPGAESPARPPPARPRTPPGPKALGAVALLGALGTALTVLLEGGPFQALGIAALLATLVGGFLVLAAPERLQEEDHRPVPPAG